MLQLPWGRVLFLNNNANIPGGGRVTLRYTFSLAQDIKIFAFTSSQATIIPTDISVARIDLQRPDVSGRENLIQQGTPTLSEITGPNMGLQGILPILEKIRPQSFIDVDLVNNTAGAIMVSFTIIGYSVSEEEDMRNQQFVSARTP